MILVIQLVVVTVTMSVLLCSGDDDDVKKSRRNSWESSPLQRRLTDRHSGDLREDSRAQPAQ